jgi:hypothetical protein
MTMNRKRFRKVCAVLAFFIVSQASPAFSSPILVSSEIFFDTFVSIDPDTASTTTISSGIPDIVGLAYDGAGTLYGVTTGSSALFTIDPSVGTTSLIGSVGFSGVQGIAVHPETGQLFGISSFGTSGDLILIDTDTGAGTLIGQTGFDNVQGLTFDSAGTLFGTHPDSSGSPATLLLEIDIETALANVTATFDDVFVQSIDFSMSGIIYGIDRRSEPTDTLLTLDPDSQTFEIIGTLEPGSHQGISFLPAVPEPSSLALLGFGLACLVVSRPAH